MTINSIIGKLEIIEREISDLLGEKMSSGRRFVLDRACAAIIDAIEDLKIAEMDKNETENI